jgi:hypothetical protein
MCPHTRGSRAFGAFPDRRSAARLAWLFLGAILARGRRTVTSWIRAAGLSTQFRPCYTTVAAAGKKAKDISPRLVCEVVKPLTPTGSRWRSPSATAKRSKTEKGTLLSNVPFSMFGRKRERSWDGLPERACFPFPAPVLMPNATRMAASG